MIQEKIRIGKVKKKRKLNKKKNSTQEELVEAIRRVKCGELTTHRVWKELGIPRSTISFDQETAIKDFVVGMAESNHPVSKRKLRKIAKSFSLICKIRLNN